MARRATGVGTGLAALAALLAGTAARAEFIVTYEDPGVYASSATFSVVGVETFNSRALGNGQSFTTSFNTNGVFSGNYTDIRVKVADQYGGVEGQGRYAVAPTTTGYSLDLTTTRPDGINYFGYWLSALDKNNRVELFRNGVEVFQYNPDNVLRVVQNNRDYFGNPGGAFNNRNMAEPYVFLNFYAVGETFDRVVFRQSASGGGYESDNHTVGYYTQRAGNVLPEPGSWALMTAGLGLVGGARRRRRSPGTTAGA